MPLLFSYGTLRQEDVQLATFGRRLTGWKDALVAYGPSLVRIEDPELARALGKTHHKNVTFNGDRQSRADGMVFEVTDVELASCDRYEARFAYNRVLASLASGKDTWVYVHLKA